MFRIDDATASATLPTPEEVGEEGYFTEGSPGVIPATLVRASFLNMVQEELRNIAIAGGLTPSKTVYTQVRDALYALFARLGFANLWTKAQCGHESALPATTGTVTLDMSLANNFGGTLTGNITLANPTNIVAGQSGVIRIVNDSTPRTISYGNYFKGAGGSLPALTASASATDDLVYYVETTTRIVIAALGDTK